MNLPGSAEQAQARSLSGRVHGNDSPVCVLVVDDNKLNREMLCTRLGDCGCEPTGVEDGTRALALLGRQSFDLVLLDVSMPGPSGFEVLEVIRRSYTAIELPVIMATARDDTDDIVRGLELGASDYVTKPFDFAVVLARVQTHLSLKRSMRQVFDLEQRLSRRNEELEAANKRLLQAHESLRRDLAAAARIQEAFLPHESPDVPGMRFAWAFQPCTQLAGDSLNVCRLGEDHLGIYVLDVSGHGVAAALLSVTATRVLAPAADPNSILARGSRSRPLAPAEVAARLNQRFPWDETTGQFFTLVYATLNVKTHELCYVSAGHPAPILLRSGEQTALLKAAGGRPIGLGDSYQDCTMTLQAGDRLYLYSDGVTEAMGLNGEQFGVTRLCQAVEESRSQTLQQSVAHVVQDVHRWGGEVLRDDLSLLALEVE